MTQTITVNGVAYALETVFEAGKQHHQAGNLAQAEAFYRQILAVAPDHADSLHLMGLLASDVGRPDIAVDYIGRAVTLNPAAANYRNNLGNALRALGRQDEALMHLREAWRLRPDSVEIASNLANSLRDGGHGAEAVSLYREALRLRPESADVLYNLANALGPDPEAEGHYRAALSLRPDFADAQYNLGHFLIGQRRWDEAEAAYRATLALQPDHARAANNLGIVLQHRDRVEDAAAAFEQAIRLDPVLTDAYYNLGCARLAESRLEEAVAAFDQALVQRPGYPAAAFARVMAQLPVLYETEAEISLRRAQYAMALQGLCALAATTPASLADGVGTSQPFFLAYQGQDDRVLQETYGGLITGIMTAAFPPAALAARPAPGEKIRVGVVSGFFHDHTLWKLFLEGWLQRLDRARFSVFGYHTGAKRDDLTDHAAALCDRFVETRDVGTADAAAGWRREIVRDRPHVLLYPEIGMDPMAAALAAMRLAPRQYVTWGHPETTGLVTIDAFLTSDLMEPAGGEAFYSERLIRLPQLATYYVPDASIAAPGVRPAGEGPVYWSGQALYKYLPQYDAIFPAIAQAVGPCRFVFIDFAKSRRVSERFRQRLGRAFAEAGLTAADYCLFLPPMPQERFMRAVAGADVVLDTPGWSGGKSTLDILATDPALVTWPGPFMRGRHTAAILTRMGVTETIAASLDDYVAIAARLGTDVSWRAGIRQRVAAGKALVYCDDAYITALQAFIETDVQEIR